MRIAAVAVCATQSFLVMDVQLEFPGRPGLLPFQREVTCEARIRWGLGNSGGWRNKDESGNDGEFRHSYLNARRDIATMKPSAKTPKPVKNRVNRPKPAR